MVSTWFKGTQINRYHSTSLGPGVKFLLMALSFFMKATRQRSLSEGTFHFRNVQHLQNLWWITTWLNLRGWVITFDFLSVSWEVQKAIFMGMGKISNPGISVLNRIKVREEGAGKKNKKQNSFGEVMGQPKSFWVSWMRLTHLVSGMLFSAGKSMDFNNIYTIVQPQLFKIGSIFSLSADLMVKTLAV